MNKLFLILALIISPLAQSQNSQGNQYIDSLLAELEVTDEVKKKITLYDQISFSLSRIDPENGVKYGFKALQLSEELKWSKGIASAHADLGVNYAALSKYTEAFSHDSIALQIYTDLNLQSSVAGVLANISTLYLAQSNYAKSLEYGFKALKINEVLNDEINRAITLENVGTVYFEQKAYDKALEYYSKAVKSYKKLKNAEGIARGHGNLGIVQDALGRYDESLQSHKEALAINRKLNIKQSIQINLVNVGIVYCHLKNYENALTYQFEALRLSEEIGGINSIAINEGNIGETYYFMATDSTKNNQNRNPKAYDRKANLSKAVHHLERAVNLCRSIGFWGPFIEFSQYLSEAFSLSGNYKMAYVAYKEYSQIRDSVFSQQNKVMISSLETQRELLLKERDVILKNKLLEIAKLQNTNKRSENIFLIIGIFLLVSVLIILLWELKRRKKSEREIKFLNGELGVKIQQLGEINKDLEAFSYSVSHDLRAPLRAVNGYAQILVEDHGSKLNEDGRKVIHVIQQNSTKMGKLIDELLAFAKLGQKELLKMEIDLGQLVRTVVDEVNNLMPNRARIKIEEMQDVIADYALLRQVIFNLVSNAIKYSSKRDAPVVEILSTRGEDEVIFLVRDNGSGFNMAYANKLFGVFQRLHSQEEFEGNGVGLALVERVIKRHGGKVWAEGEIEKGATFYFSLPTSV